MAERRELAVEDLAQMQVLSEAHPSPDGETVAYCATRIDLERDRAAVELSLLSATGAPLLGPLPGRLPRWSPSGALIAYLGDRGEESEVRLLEVASGRDRLLASFPGGLGALTFAPDGRRLAVGLTRHDGAPARIVVVELDSGAVELVPGGEGDDIGPAFSPDGARLAFATEGIGPRGPEGKLRVWALGDTVRPEPLRTGLAFVSYPSFSPDGSMLACVGTRERRLGPLDPCLQPWVLPAGGGESRLAAEDVNGVILSPGPHGPVWLEDGSRLAFRAARAGDIDIVAVGLDDPAAPRRLTTGHQVSSFGATADGERIAFTASTAADPGALFLVDRDGDARLLRSSGTVLPGLERRRFAAPTGGELDGWLQGLDPDLAPQPLLVSMHGGPHHFVGSGNQLGHFHRSVLASRGWIVLTLNPSGSGSYPAPFADSIRGRWGERDLPEYLAAVDRLVAGGLADPDRLAVAGYSYGGYLAAWAACHTSRFKAAVVGAPIANLESFRSSSDIGPWFIPWELGQSNGERLSPVTHARAVSTPMLLLHGEADRRCPIGQSEELEAAILAAGRARVELVRFPGADHLFYAGGRPTQRLAYNRHIVEWVERMTTDGSRTAEREDGRLDAPASRKEGQ